MGTVTTAGHWLRSRRIARQLTQAEAAKAAGISSQAVSRLEKGTGTKPPMEDIVKYGVVLQTTPNELAQQYGYWIDPHAPRREEDARLAKLRPVLEVLPDDKKAQVYGLLDYAYTMALATSAAARVTAER